MCISVALRNRSQEVKAILFSLCLSETMSGLVCCVHSVMQNI